MLPALWCSCRKLPDPVDGPEEMPEDPPVVVVDSVTTRIRLLTEGRSVGTLDLFVYDSEGTRPLEVHRTAAELPEGWWAVQTLPGDKLVVGIANSPRRFNLNALGRYDAMEQLSFRFGDDNPQRPILGGSCRTDAQLGEIVLRPLLCRVVLVSVANTMDGYELLEDPRVRLLDLPDGAQILRDREFRPSELIDEGDWVALPWDVGYFPQACGISLWCYPNDTPEDILGVPRPTLEFECRILGESCSFEVPLPPLNRGCTKEVELTVDGPGDYSYKIH